MFTIPHVTSTFTTTVVYSFLSSKGTSKHLFLLVVALFTIQAKTTISKACV